MNRFRNQVREVINRNIVVSLALAKGFNVFLPVYDGGVDFILYRESDRETRNVQLKGRWTIDRKYEGRDIWIAFPIDGEWYLMPHEKMVEQAGEVLQSVSWTRDGLYSRGKPSEAVKTQCEPYRFARIADVATEAAQEDPA